VDLRKFILVGLLVFIASGVAGAQTAPILSGPRTYKDSTYGLSLKLAENWHLTPGTGKWKFASGDSLGKKGYRSTVSLEIRQAEETNDLKSAMQRDFQKMTKVLSKVKFSISSQGPAAAGVPSYKLEYVMSGRGKSSAAIWLLAQISPSKQFRMTATCEGADWKSVLPEARALIDSVRFPARK
jgi:hypothetical protein